MADAPRTPSTDPATPPCTNPAHPALSHKLLLHAHQNLQTLVPRYGRDILRDLIAASINIADAAGANKCLVCQTDAAQDVVFLTGLTIRGVGDDEVLEVVLGAPGEPRERKKKVVEELRRLWDMYREQRGGEAERVAARGREQEEEARVGIAEGTGEREAPTGEEAERAQEKK